MNIVILIGPPGCGKGTQSKILEQEYGFVQISTGDILREKQKDNSDLAKKLKDLMSQGKLVPDEIILEVTYAKINELINDNVSVILLDGFPRTLYQAEQLDSFTDLNKIKIRSVISMKITESDLVKRITGRYSCANCGQGYNDFFIKPKIENICDKCGSSSFKRRDDDNAETVKKRYAEFVNQTMDVVDFYNKKGLLKEVDSTLSTDLITARIKDIISLEGNL